MTMMFITTSKVMLVVMTLMLVIVMAVIISTVTVIVMAVIVSTVMVMAMVTEETPTICRERRAWVSTTRRESTRKKVLNPFRDKNARDGRGACYVTPDLSYDHQQRGGGRGAKKINGMMKTKTYKIQNTTRNSTGTGKLLTINSIRSIRMTCTTLIRF